MYEIKYGSFSCMRLNMNILHDVLRDEENNSIRVSYIHIFDLILFYEVKH